MALCRAGFRAAPVAVGGLTLTVVGDGPSGRRASVFTGMEHRVKFVGAVEQRVAEQFRRLICSSGRARSLMVYLSVGARLPGACRRRPGVRDVVRDGGWLVPRSDPVALAAMIDRLAGDRQSVIRTGERGRAQVARDHLLGSAVATLSAALEPLMRGSVR